MRLVALLDPWEAQLLIVLVPREVRGVAVETARDLQLDVLVEGRKAVTIVLFFLPKFLILNIVLFEHRLVLVLLMFQRVNSLFTSIAKIICQ